MPYANFGNPCSKDSDCGTSVLGCDTSPLGNRTNTCRSLYGRFCQAFEFCADNLQCENHFCFCVKIINIIFLSFDFK